MPLIFPLPGRPAGRAADSVNIRNQFKSHPQMAPSSSDRCCPSIISSPPWACSRRHAATSQPVNTSARRAQRCSASGDGSDEATVSVNSPTRSVVSAPESSRVTVCVVSATCFPLGRADGSASPLQGHFDHAETVLRNQTAPGYDGAQVIAQRAPVEQVGDILRARPQASGRFRYAEVRHRRVPS